MRCDAVPCDSMRCLIFYHRKSILSLVVPSDSDSSSSSTHNHHHHANVGSVDDSTIQTSSSPSSDKKSKLSFSSTIFSKSYSKNSGSPTISKTQSKKILESLNSVGDVFSDYRKPSSNRSPAGAKKAKSQPLTTSSISAESLPSPKSTTTSSSSSSSATTSSSHHSDDQVKSSKSTPHFSSNLM
eukprot:TRINITY_DN1763_c0_g1_i2.p1 TRINITY_DN1763_c0_g1~~TRINITY_DN1763_c0_g1_i2.p1  ORF type:complete len:184 (-),score=70.24 TRINITY_DN1763_c0_g1_i2:212-763(-)